MWYIATPTLSANYVVIMWFPVEVPISGRAFRHEIMTVSHLYIDGDGTDSTLEHGQGTGHFRSPYQLEQV